MTPDTRTTENPEPPIETPLERLHREFGYLLDMYGARNDESGHWANCRDIIEAEAAQGAAPLAYCTGCGYAHPVNDVDCIERAASRVEGAAPRAEGLDIAEHAADWPNGCPTCKRAFGSSESDG